MSMSMLHGLELAVFPCTCSMGMEYSMDMDMQYGKEHAA
jgi:hypothetical protein